MPRIFDNIVVPGWLRPEGNRRGRVMFSAAKLSVILIQLSVTFVDVLLEMRVIDN